MITRILVALVAASIGVVVFIAADLPLPWLLGPMFACLIVSLAGVRLSGPPLIGDAMRTVLGVAVGASITPDVAARLPDMAVSIALIPPFILAIGLVGYPYFRKLCKFDAATSYYGAMPGGLQDMLVFGEEAGGNVRHLSLIHATRVLIVVSALPVALTYVLGLSMDQPIGQPAADIPPLELLYMVIIAIVGWLGAKRIGLFGASILGPLILATIASLAGLIHSRPPMEAILAAQFFIGLAVGVKYVGITWSELSRVVLAAVGYTALIGVLSLAFAEIVIHLGLAPETEALLAFSPGGQAEMTVLAIVAGADIAFVVTHHLTRIVVVIIGAPIVRKWLS
ncbi:AbrB family transcriptional regulator [uncultured Litoreibacter sp.]|uniref:AbrB family transcriptional regulator n=1 Tax=uncultured Litoreibacter sp. TaxID=1392394 RepID=UPI002620277A|nr:AbrB family transcriptional regulator [uncultured Litoreibacter sp.]